MLREAGHVGRYALHARAGAGDAVRLDLPAAPRAAARARGRGAGAPARRRPRPAPGDARAPLRAGGAGRAARPGDRLRAGRRAPRRPAAGLGGGGAALPGGAAGARAGGRGRRPRARRAAARAGRVGGAGGHGGGGARDVPAPRSGPRAQLGDPVLLDARRARRGRAVVGAVALGPGARRAARRGARRRSPEEDSPLRARLLARMSLELYYAGEPELRLALVATRRCAIARRIGDPRTLATCLDARHYALWRPENVEERLEVAAELRRVAEETGDPELELQGAGWTIIDLMELGDIEGVDIQIAAASKLAEALHRPIWLWWTSLFRGARAQLGGRLRRGRAARPGDARDRPARPGRERPALLRAGDVQHPPRAGPPGRGRGRRARLHRALPGDPGLARRARAAADRARAPGRGARGVRGGRRGRLRGVPARRELADRDHADGRGVRRAGRRARGPRSSTRLLEPYAGRNVVVGRNATCNGSASRLLGPAGGGAAASGTLAERHFDEAQAMHAAMGARPLARAHAGRLRGDAAARRGPGDVERAREMLADAILVADALGMVVLAERARRLVPAAAGLEGPRGGARKARALRGGEPAAWRGSSRVVDCGGDKPARSGFSTAAAQPQLERRGAEAHHPIDEQLLFVTSSPRGPSPPRRALATQPRGPRGGRTVRPAAYRQ